MLPKKKVAKMAMFGPKPWVNPFWKTVNFSTFWTFCFYSLERRFTFWNIINNIFWPILPKKKELEKWPFLDQNHGLTNPFGKMTIFRLFGLHVFIA